VTIGLWALGVGLTAVAIAEVFLRYRYGLGDPPLYLVDARTGYRLAPHQQLRRRGKRMEINQYSMRGPKISPQPAARTLRVLMMGGSLVNGGWAIDQDDLLSLQLETALAPLQPGLERVEVLNASAHGWGPRNQLGYLLRFGTFGAQMVLLVLNTDDLFVIAPHSYDLGRNPQYPTRRPRLALQEVIARQRRYTPSAKLQALYDQRGDRVGVNLEALRQIHQVVNEARGHLLLTFTPLRRELSADSPEDHEGNTRQRLTDFAQRQGIPCLDCLPLLAQTQAAPLYLDPMHLSAQGNAWLSQVLARWIVDTWSRQSDLDSRPPETPANHAHDVTLDLW
jgi:hypothetical protein